MTNIKDKLKYCGDCPYLVIEPEHEVYWDCPEKHVNDARWTEEQKNYCQLENDRIIEIRQRSGTVKEYKWMWLEDGKNPRRHPGCLILVKHIISTLKSTK